ncbi:unnamed protein product [Thelazia callipaeda]|uniref:C2H2-type domain-containing protein n=1 Tax=Thelazia callipaeda TaxID=103827 RepID=A0A0N5CKV0_THECL|nr:unnamed protein product [Thelazia callipaeda]
MVHEVDRTPAIFDVLEFSESYLLMYIALQNCIRETTEEKQEIVMPVPVISKDAPSEPKAFYVESAEVCGICKRHFGTLKGWRIHAAKMHRKVKQAAVEMYILEWCPRARKSIMSDRRKGQARPIRYDWQAGNDLSSLRIRFFTSENEHGKRGRTIFVDKWKKNAVQSLEKVANIAALEEIIVRESIQNGGLDQEIIAVVKECDLRKKFDSLTKLIKCLQKEVRRVDGMEVLSSIRDVDGIFAKENVTELAMWRSLATIDEVKNGANTTHNGLQTPLKLQ